jgi:hypothetical protein
MCPASLEPRAFAGLKNKIKNKKKQEKAKRLYIKKPNKEKS